MTIALYDYQKYFLNYLVYLYGGKYEVKDTILFIYSGKDIYKVSLLDGSRFNCWTFFHKNYTHNLGNWHKDRVCKEFEYGIFRSFTHSFNKENNIPFSPEDFKRFKQDALKYKIL